ncbi:Hypothetical protein NTJ_10536 [Nesidiocoris tenuis]|uniref:Uncharacterized protein n=1 Tax=Nesidiocoris tenuis TaxID=355587 RepID=A0ABN7AZX6_9HEMI|nr:Hypothetical protein NTJ_10536 [Nesidiocoris tenuis]
MSGNRSKNRGHAPPEVAREEFVRKDHPILSGKAVSSRTPDPEVLLPRVLFAILRGGHHRQRVGDLSPTSFQV